MRALFYGGLFLALLLNRSGATIVATLEPTVGGFLADDNRDGVFDRAEPGSLFVVGGGAGSLAREYQGSYEYNLTSLGQNLQIISATLYLTRTGVTGASSNTPNLLGEVGSYIADGVFALNDADAGTRIGTFAVWNHNLKPWPHQDAAFDVTSLLNTLYSGSDRIIGFNFRASSLPATGTVDNGFNRPTIRLEYVVVPEPSAVALAICGMSVLFLRKRSEM